MGSIVNAIVGGVSGNTGGAGVNYQAGSANLQTPTTAAQAEEQYKNVQQGLAQQQAFLNAVQSQGGLQNQANVYNQLQGISQGTGPNPAQAALNQATQANVANQAAMMAGQRGSSSNPALIARQAAQQGANTQQQAVGQGATLQAQQQMNALNQMGSLATNQANQQANATNAFTNAAQGAQGQILGAIGGQNQAQVGNIGSQNQANAGIAGQVAGGQMNVVGGTASAIGKAMMMAQGGEVPDIDSQFKQLFADGGMATTELQPTMGATEAPQSRIGQFFTSLPESTMAPQNTNAVMAQAGKDIGGAVGSGLGKMMGPQASGNSMSGGANTMQAFAFAAGGPVPALVSPGETYLKPNDVSKVKKGANPLEVGEKIPGKPKVAGNSYANDTIPKTLESGGIVIPNSIMQSKDPKKKAAEFVAAVLKQKALKGK